MKSSIWGHITIVMCIRPAGGSAGSANGLTDSMGKESWLEMQMWASATAWWSLPVQDLMSLMGIKQDYLVRYLLCVGHSALCLEYSSEQGRHGDFSKELALSPVCHQEWSWLLLLLNLLNVRVEASLEIIKCKLQNLFPIYSWGNWGLERLSDLLKSIV